MNREERRRCGNRKRVPVYMFTEEQLSQRIKQEIESHVETQTQKAQEQALKLALTLSMEVLMDFYWPKSYGTKIPSFITHVLEYYEMWLNGELDMKKMEEDLWEFGRVKMEVEE